MVVLYVLAKLSSVSPGWTITVPQPAGGGQAATTVGVLLGEGEGEDV